MAWCTWQPRNTGPEITRISSTTDENHKFEGIYAPINQVHDFQFTLSWFLGLDILEEPVILALTYWTLTIYRARNPSVKASMHYWSTQDHCKNVSEKWYYVASCLFCDTFKVKYPISGANSAFGFINEFGKDITLVVLCTVSWKWIVQWVALKG